MPAEAPSVLVVDDDLHVRESIVDELGDRYAVTSAESGEDACEILESQRFDAVISDVRMGGMDGVELMRRIRTKAKNTVRILLTGYSDEAAIEAANAPEGVYKLGKPWGDELEITLKRALEHRSSLHEAKEEASRLAKGKHRATLAVYKLDKLASLGRLASGIEHEMRSPLACLTSNVSWLREENRRLQGLLESVAMVIPELPEEMAEVRQGWKKNKPIDTLREFTAVFSECSDSIQRLSTVLRGITTYARSDAQSSRSVVSVARCVESAVNLVRCKYKHDVEVVVVPPESELAVLVNEGELTQVIINLLMNAVQAMESGQATVTQRLENEFAVIEVEDEGGGVSEAVRSKLFEMFFTTHEDLGCSGLGLPISREIMARHGGEVYYRGDGPFGAIFGVRVPLAREDWMVQ